MPLITPPLHPFHRRNWVTKKLFVSPSYLESKRSFWSFWKIAYHNDKWDIAIFVNGQFLPILLNAAISVIVCLSLQ